ncbi:MAG: 30S ribosomal protein S20 [Pseudomonadota bacterium]
MATDRLRKKLGKGRHLSALKRERQNEKRNTRNRAAKSSLRTAIKKARTTPSAESLKAAIPQIDKAASKGLIPKRRASRIISRLSRTIPAAS